MQLQLAEWGCGPELGCQLLAELCLGTLTVPTSPHSHSQHHRIQLNLI